MKYRQGDLVIVKYPFTDLSDSKVRPGLIVSNSDVNITGDFIIAMITSKKVDAKNSVKLKTNDLDIPLKDKNEPYVYCKKIAVLNNDIIHKKISSIKNDDIKNIILEKIVSNFKKE